MKTPQEKIEELLKELEEPINCHPSRVNEFRALRNEMILRKYLIFQLNSLKRTGKTL